MNDHQKIAQAIIRYQERIIGPLAWNEADKVAGLDYDSNKNVVMNGDSKEILENLVKQYENLFGRASVEACKDAVRPFVSQMKDEDLPPILL